LVGLEVTYHLVSVQYVMFLCPMIVGKGIKPIFNGFEDSKILELKTKTKIENEFYSQIFSVYYLFDWDLKPKM